jgi:hypothetical protein
MTWPSQLVTLAFFRISNDDIPSVARPLRSSNYGFGLGVWGCNVNSTRVSSGTQFSTIVLAGLVSGGFDAVYAMVYFGTSRGIQPHRIFQHIASGLLGTASYELGWKSVLLGVFCHFTIALGAAAIFSLAAALFPGLLKRALLVGPLFGLMIYLCMNFVVIPLSRVTARSGPTPVDVVVLGVIVHMFLIGLPIVLIVRSGSHRLGDHLSPVVDG